MTAFTLHKLFNFAKNHRPEETSPSQDSPHRLRNLILGPLAEGLLLPGAAFAVHSLLLSSTTPTLMPTFRLSICVEPVDASPSPFGVPPEPLDATLLYEYLRHLAAELGDEYAFREQGEEPTLAPEAGKGEAPKEIELPGTIGDLRALAKECAVFFIGAQRRRSPRMPVHDSFREPFATSGRCFLPENSTLHMCATLRNLSEALALAIRLGDPALIREDFNGPGNPLMKRQLAFLPARAQIPIERLRAPSESPEEEIDIEDEFPELLILHISDDVSMEAASLATFALGFIFVGSENGEIKSPIPQAFTEKAERSDGGLDEKRAQFIALGLGLSYLGLQDASDMTIEMLKAIEHPISKTAIIVVACFFSGTCDVLKVQAMLHHCDELIVVKEKEKTNQPTPAEGVKEEPKPEVKQIDTFQSFPFQRVRLFLVWVLIVLRQLV
ncbi:hypothetical protein B0H11DRAFT_2381626 [Mycena galericulata]|nr:hypothetical protein B0H11DRAFT_2381626 [Mycena galericulata]